MVKEEIARNKQLLLFPPCFLAAWKTFCHFHQVYNCCLQTLWVYKSLKFVVCETVNPFLKNIIADLSNFKAFCRRKVNPFPNKPWFLRVCSTSLLKTLWEKEKLLVTSNFSFSHGLFYPFGKLCCHFHQILRTRSVWKNLKSVVWERVKCGLNLVCGH